MSLEWDDDKRRAARRAAGLDQSRLAELVGVGGQARFSNWETGLVVPFPQQLTALSRVLGVSIRVLLLEVPPDRRDLRRLRLESGLTIGELADRVGVASPTWIERTYHRRRRQDRLDRLTPVEFETIMTTPASQAA